MASKTEQAADDWQPAANTEGRDAGVSDEVWEQLQRDSLAAEAAEKEYNELQSEAQNLRKQVEKLNKETLQKGPDGDDEAAKRYEQARLQRELDRRKKEEELEELQRQRERIEQNRRKEQQAQRKLREMGVCVAGFRWIKQPGGYRCAGGSHSVSDRQLGI
jgi:IS5 family transposase